MYGSERRALAGVVVSRRRRKNNYADDFGDESTEGGGEWLKRCGIGARMDVSFDQKLCVIVVREELDAMQARGSSTVATQPPNCSNGSIDQR